VLPNDGTGAAVMLEALNAGQNGVSLIGHGSHSGACCLNSENVQTLANNPGIFLALACNTAMFDSERYVPGQESLGEYLLLNPRGGAVAFIGPSRMSSTGDGPLAVSFWTEMTSAERIGPLFNTAMLTPAYGADRAAYNLLGDPAMRIWTFAPSEILLSVPGNIFAGESQTLQVTVTKRYPSGNTGPLSGAVVSAVMFQSIMHEPLVFAVAVTDQHGQASLPVTPHGGNLTLTATGKNLIPVTATIAVKKRN
jgi:hypothetical protein